MEKLTRSDIDRLIDEYNQQVYIFCAVLNKELKRIVFNATDIPSLLEAAEYGLKAKEFFKDLDCRYRDFGNNPRLEIVLKNAKAAGLLEGE